MDLIQALKQGDKRQLQLFYEANRDPFLRFAQRYSLSKEDVLDIYQDAIIAFIENIEKGKINELKSSVTTYLFAIGKLMIFQKLKKGVQTDFCTDFENLGMVWEEFDEDDAQHDEQNLARALAKLGDQCKVILELFYYRGMKLETIRTTLGYESKDVVKSQKSRCLSQLKKLMK